MIAMDPLVGLMFIGFPIIVVIAAAHGEWVRRSDHPKAVEQRRINDELAQSVTFDDDDRNYELEAEQLQYYRNKNFDRQQGRE